MGTAGQRSSDLQESDGEPDVGQESQESPRYEYMVQSYYEYGHPDDVYGQLDDEYGSQNTIRYRQPDDEYGQPEDEYAEELDSELDERLESPQRTKRQQKVLYLECLEKRL